jgi:hypothetical protein
VVLTRETAMSGNSDSSQDELVVRTDVTAGANGEETQHSEELVVRTDITAGGQMQNHAEGLVAR